MGVLELSFSPWDGEKVLVSGRGIVLSTDWVSVTEPLILPLVTVKV
jgi:hypothetical protein